MTLFGKLLSFVYGELLHVKDALRDHWLGYVLAALLGGSSLALTTAATSPAPAAASEQSPSPLNELRLLLEDIQSELRKCLDSRYDRPCRDNHSGGN